MTDRITHKEAEQIALAYIDKAFNNPEKPGRRIRHSIPANPREDTDLRLMAYIKQQAEADTVSRAELDRQKERAMRAEAKLTALQAEHEAALKELTVALVEAEKGEEAAQARVAELEEKAGASDDALYGATRDLAAALDQEHRIDDPPHLDELLGLVRERSARLATIEARVAELEAQLFGLQREMGLPRVLTSQESPPAVEANGVQTVPVPVEGSLPLRSRITKLEAVVAVARRIVLECGFADYNFNGLLVEFDQADAELEREQGGEET